MLRAIYVMFAIVVIGGYVVSSWFGWELASSGSRSGFGHLPFITGYRGGK